ncbi:MAG: hypothetical protein J3K34DRAFT_95156 [Monoraphidium minutum]|nr:MAG: hypothetical protein J3K34DRAFT_95156 [Monoraphidium minutum]
MHSPERPPQRRRRPPLQQAARRARHPAAQGPGRGLPATSPLPSGGVAPAPRLACGARAPRCSFAARRGPLSWPGGRCAWRANSHTATRGALSYYLSRALLVCHAWIICCSPPPLGPRPLLTSGRLSTPSRAPARPAVGPTLTGGHIARRLPSRVARAALFDPRRAFPLSLERRRPSNAVKARRPRVFLQSSGAASVGLLSGGPRGRRRQTNARKLNIHGHNTPRFEGFVGPQLV